MTQHNIIPAPKEYAESYKRSLTYWTAKDDEELKKLWRTGLSAADIGAELKRTRSAVMGRVHRLNLPPRRVSGRAVDHQASLSHAQKRLYRKLRNGGLSAEEAAKEARK